MRVRFDDQIFRLQSRGGISRYFVELMLAYRADPTIGVELEPRVLWTLNHHLIDAGMGRRLPTRWGDRRRVLRVANRMHRERRAPDVIHHTYYEPDGLSRDSFAGVRAVTVYDMIPELYPDAFPRGNPHLEKRAFVEAADVVFCISEATKSDLVELYGRPAAPIVVTHLGVDDAFRPDAPCAADLPDRYLLFVGSRGGYKDFSVLVEAMAACEMPEEVMLLVTGGGPLSVSELELVESLGLSARVRKVDLADSELAGAYAHALCLVFPSRHEGFGLPTLEAMASGCPVVASSCPALLEVAGGAALHFPPGDREALARVLGDVVASPELRSGLRAKGLARAEKFTWEETARRTASAYREVGAV